MNAKLLLFYLIILIVCVALVDFGAYMQFSKVLQISIQGIVFVIPSIIGLIFGILFILVVHFSQKLKAMQIYEELAKIDTLTGATSRYACELILDIEYKRNLRNKQAFCIIMIDIDNFKQINDTYGHSIGDQVLRSLTRCLESNLRDMDIVCRWGGEEFIVVLPDTHAPEAMNIAKTLCQSVSSYDFNPPDKVTISLGVTSTEKECKNIEMMIDKADKALYRAKEFGKDCVIFEP